MTTRVDVYTVEGQCGLTVVGQPVVCEELAITLFMRGYLPVMGTIKPALKPIMAKHLKELMADANVYWWSLVTAYHAVWPQQIENAMPSGVTPTPSGSSGGHWCSIHPLRLLDTSQQWQQGALRRRTPRQAAYHHCGKTKHRGMQCLPTRQAALAGRPPDGATHLYILLVICQSPMCSSREVLP